MADIIKNESLGADARLIVRRLAQRFGELPQVVAVVLAGSRGAGVSDLESDFDLYVYTMDEVAVEFRRALLGEAAEIDNRFWEPGDEWFEPATCTQLDIMYRSPEWIEDQLDRVLVRQESAIGYTTCFWYNVVHSEALCDPLVSLVTEPRQRPISRRVAARRSEEKLADSAPQSFIVSMAN